MRILKVFLLSFALFFAFGFALAQEEPLATDAAEEIELDEEVEAEDLEVKEPRILPDHPFYFLKGWARGIQSTFTFDPVKKAGLRLRFANEKLVEARKLAKTKENPNIIKRGIENYQDEIENIKTAVDKIKEKAAENPKVSSFLDKFIKQQILHHRVLQKLETQVPSEAFEKIQEARERHLGKFADVMAKLEDRKEKIAERLETKMTEIKGSEFKDFKNLEILKELEERMPEAVKGAVLKVRENTLKRLKTTIEKMPTEKLDEFKAYTERITGTKEKQMEILENLKEGFKAKPKIQEKLMESRGTILEKVRERAVEKNCPEIQKPASDFCKKGRVIVKKDEQDCIVSFDCIIPAEAETSTTQVKEGQFCITLWDPVCGKDGKTYSNSCFAKIAGVEIDHQGTCKEILIRESLKRVLPKIAP